MKKSLEIGQTCHLSDLLLGQKAKVLALHNDNKALRRRLLDMGITKDVVITIKKIVVVIFLTRFITILCISSMWNL